MNNMTVKEVEVILRETGETIRERLQHLANQGFNDFSVHVRTTNTLGKPHHVDVVVQANLIT